MQEDAKQTATVPPEIQEVIRNLVSAFRAVKLYPPNNPIYAQSVHKSFESLDGYLEAAASCSVGVQRDFFLFDQVPVAKDTSLNKTIAQDIFSKGIREIIFLQGVMEDELLEVCKAVALSAEDLALQNGIVSVLWEKGAVHVRVTETALEEVITTSTPDQPIPEKSVVAPGRPLDPGVAVKEVIIAGRTLVLGDLIGDPRKFGATMLEIAQQTASEDETVEDRLHSLFQEAGKKILEEHPEQSEALFEGLAKSVLAMEPKYRDSFIATKLYGGLDADQVREETREEEATVGESHELHEIVTGRFSKQWTVQQIAQLLKKASTRKIEAPMPRRSPAEIEATPIPDDLGALTAELAEYTPEEMEALKSMGEVGTESDILEATVRTLIFLLPLVKSRYQPSDDEKAASRFSNIVKQLEDMVGFLLKNGDYDLATIIVKAFHMPVAAEFRQRLADAVKNASTRDVISGVITDMRKHAKGSREYIAAYSYLSVLDREATPVLLEILAVEKDRAIRKYLMEILKELGKNQIELLGRRITDSRWYFVRNIVNILAESRTDEAVDLMERVAFHKQIQIRQEVIKGLIAIGGKKAAAVLLKMVQDKELDVQLAAIRGLGMMSGAGPDEAKVLQAFLSGLPFRRREMELTVESIRTLGKIGDPGTSEFMQQYLKLRWWRSRRLQGERRAAAEAAIQSIERRQGDAGRTN